MRSVPRSIWSLKVKQLVSGKPGAIQITQLLASSRHPLIKLAIVLFFVFSTIANLFQLIFDVAMVSIDRRDSSFPLGDASVAVPESRRARGIGLMTKHGMFLIDGLMRRSNCFLIASGAQLTKFVVKSFALKVGLLLLLVATGTIPVSKAFAQTPETRSARVAFAKGQSSIVLRDSITGRQMVLYRINASRGQVLTANLTATNAGTGFNLYLPGRGPGNQAMAIGDQLGPNVPALNRMKVTLPSDGTYTISVFLNRAAARRGESTRFSIDLAIRSVAASQLPTVPGGQPVGEGSQYLSVFGLGAGDNLNMRAGPSTSFGVIDRLSMGTVVRNLGCSRDQRGQSWCEVHRIGQPRRSGWASAKYLRPAPAPDGGTASQLPGQPPATASGTLRCQALTISARCPYSITRRGNGAATLTVNLLPGVQRRIEFSGGRPISSNGKGSIFAEWKGSDVIVTIGELEIYTVPDSVLFGG